MNELETPVMTLPGVVKRVTRSANQRKSIAIAIALVAGAFPSAFCTSSSAQPAATEQAGGSASLNINPKRITFDRLGRTASIFLFNQGTAAGVYDISFVDRVMLPTGQIRPTDEADGAPEVRDLSAKLQSARSMMLVTPRRVLLKPGTGQTIRLRAGGTGDWPAGEYRTHLTVTAVPPPDTGLTADQAANAEPGAVSFRIASVLGISIPVIVRIGTPQVEAAIENTRFTMESPGPGSELNSPTPVVTFDLVRRGPNSLFGDVEIRKAKARREDEPLGVVRGIGVYPEIERRQVKIALRSHPQRGEQISVVFTDQDTAPGKILAQSQISLP
ncbi:hypothetical protein [Sphingobium sp. B12D2B]|uniref:hypothetical protein n=1 Tax=Sphingobium sp. B12D2B TaxID=2940577 RepID=UPI00222485D5|nr:hypothetical protein [Sphingobium sp. B12D2B]MCW2348567.1 hypothetical protein [Sphingobium sp. B12D2B]